MAMSVSEAMKLLGEAEGGTITIGSKFREACKMGKLSLYNCVKEASKWKSRRKKQQKSLELLLKKL